MSTGKNRYAANLKTPSGSFSSVVAVTQGAINAGLESLFALEPEVGHVKFRAHDGTMDAELSAGQAILPVTENNQGMVYYHCIFESGNITVWDDDLDDMTPPIDVSGWKFAFSVNMSKINVPPDTDEHKKVKEVINQPGDYSISRLYLDFNTAAIAAFDQQRSSFGSYKFPNDSQLNSFKSLMLKWGSPNTGVMADPKRSTFGYMAETDKPETINPQAPTFPPTSLMYQIYPFVEEGSSDWYDGLDDKGNKNMLLYLEMTDNKSFPVERSLSYSGNFAAGMDGTVCLNREVFWDSFLLRDAFPRLLRTLNEATFAWVTSASVDYNGVSVSHGYTVGCGSGSGLDTEDDFYAWEKVDSHNWKWSKANEKHDDKGLSGVFDGTIDIYCNTDNAISISSGSNLINLSGKTYMSIKVNTHTFGAGEGFEASSTMDWKLDMTMDSVKDGGLQISMNLPDNLSDAFPVTSHQNSWPLDIHDEAANELAGHMNRSLNRAPLPQAEEQLQEALKGTARFVLPGGGTFFYKNPMFNDNGDLMLEVSYNGVS